MVETFYQLCEVINIIHKEESIPEVFIYKHFLYNGVDEVNRIIGNLHKMTIFMFVGILFLFPSSLSINGCKVELFRYLMLSVLTNLFPCLTISQIFLN